jgi:hypothetical protein
MTASYATRYSSLAGPLPLSPSCGYADRGYRHKHRCEAATLLLARRSSSRPLTGALEDRFRSIVEHALRTRTLAFMSSFDTLRDVAVEVFTPAPESPDSQPPTELHSWRPPGFSLPRCRSR